MQQLAVETVATPLGDFHMVADRQGRLRIAEFADQPVRLQRLLARQFGKAGFQLQAGTIDPAFAAALSAYFAGQLTALSALSTAAGGTPFQQNVWAALHQIPPGQKSTYGSLAMAIGKPSAARAVGHANGANPLSIIVPCHRLTGANGALTGYGGGLTRKRWLLDHEARNCAGI